MKAAGVGLLAAGVTPAWADEPARFRIATFSSDATPPLGHPLCGGWIEPAKAVDDPLRALGIVLLPQSEKPIVLCAVDWCGILNDANQSWRKALADAVGTTPDRVALHTIHAHNAPFADLRAEELLAAGPVKQQLMDIPYFRQAVEQSAEAARKSLDQARPITHVGTGQARVEQVASNRRVIGPDGKVLYWRGSSCKDPAARAAPEGLIDPWLKTLSFWNGEQPIAALHYYACHPMSYYGDGRLTPDFCGLAREVMQREHPHVHQLYFAGAGGNIAPGKYNDGSHENRPVLVERMVTAMRSAWKDTARKPLETLTWRNAPTRLFPRAEPDFSAEACQKVLVNEASPKAQRGHAALKLAWLERQERPFDIACLDAGSAQVVHLPGEPFVEYQLFAQSQRPDGFVCTAGYGDDGSFYIPTADAYPQGGYEVGVAFTAAQSEALLHAALAKVLARG
jgi:hypothetical protein